VVVVTAIIVGSWGGNRQSQPIRKIRAMLSLKCFISIIILASLVMSQWMD